MNEEMRTWLEARPPWVSTLFWIGMSATAIVILLGIVVTVWLAFFFGNR